jgi:hypothetical protein
MNIKTFLFVSILIWSFSSCRSTRDLNKAIAPVDSGLVLPKVDSTKLDSVRVLDSAVRVLKGNHIDFHTFSAKIKVDVDGSMGKQPDLTVIVRMVKDSVIWMSVSSTILNIEVYRMLITRDSVILMNKQEKEVQFRSLDYLQEVTEIPFDFGTLQDLLVGNPIFFSDSIISFEQRERHTLISARGIYFKNLLTLSREDLSLLNCKLDDLDPDRHRTASFSYGEYDYSPGFAFPADRRIIVAEKNNIDIRMQYKQFEFNKELSVSFHIPRNYKRK